MLHTKFKGHRSTGSGEEDFSRFLPYMGMVPSWAWDPDHLNNLSYLKALEAVYEIWLQSAVSEEKSFEIVDGRTDDGACLYYKFPRAFGSGELKIMFVLSCFCVQNSLNVIQNRLYTT